MNSEATDFYIVAREPGAEHPAIPTWASRVDNPAALEVDPVATVSRRDISAVPGAFQLLDVLSSDECARLISFTESLGYLADAAVSLPRSIRHNHNATWIADDVTTDIIWQRCRAQFRSDDDYDGKQALGINSRFRFYRYGEGDYFAAHSDGSWPGSRVVDGELITNAFDDRWSQLTFLLFLSEDYLGGATQFYVDAQDAARPARGLEGARKVDIRTPLGAALCFPHGMHPLHCLHSSQAIQSGLKYIIRADVLFEL
ncbi:MAG: oxidoreductase [Gammaproteobacteria bacterium]|nr:oxidoreductase [Gammaproteobacteria bacterium]